MRYLFVTFDGGGNLPPELALARRLSSRGHSVRFLGHRSQRAAVEESGFAFSQFEHTPDYDSTWSDASPVKDWEPGDPGEIYALLLEHLVFGRAAQVARDVADELERHPVDALAVDFFLVGALAAAERSAMPTAVLWHTGYIPGGWGNAGLPVLNAARQAIGLDPLDDTYEQYNRVERVLVMTSREFDFAITTHDLPPNVRHIGPQLSLPTTTHLDPSNDSPPLIVVGFSTTYQAQGGVRRRVVDALGLLPVRGLVTTGPAVSLGPDVPSNVQVSAWIAHADVMPAAALVVTHAGLGTVMTALVYGVPLICMPMGRDQDGNAARVDYKRLGLVLPHTAGVAEIADAITSALADSDLRTNARRLAHALRDEIATDRGVTEMELLAARDPDLRSTDGQGALASGS